jgi:hypothetical protein
MIFTLEPELLACLDHSAGREVGLWIPEHEQTGSEAASR